MEKFNKNSVIVAIAISITFCLVGPIAALAATTPSLGYASTFGVLGSTYTNTAVGTTINGDLGYTTGPAVAPTVNGTTYVADSVYNSAGTDQGTALTNLNSQPCTYIFPSGAVDLATYTMPSSTIGTYTPGVYCTAASSAASIGTAGITLSGSGTYIFIINGGLTTVTGSSVILTNGASASDVFWAPTSATTLAANTTFVGTDIDASGITIGSTVTWLGRALAFGGTVSTDADTITVPNIATLHVIKLVVGGTAVPSGFTIHVENTSSTDVAGSPQPGTASPGTSYALAAGTYSVSEGPHTGYTQSFSGACDSSGNITLSAGDNKICTIINTAIAVVAPVVSSGGGGAIVPLIGLIKVPTPLALPAGPGKVTYTYTVWNVGGAAPLTNVTVTDNKCAPVTYVSGDANNNGQLDFHEKWIYSCTTTLASTTTNTAIATGKTGSQTAIATALATVIVGTPVPKLPNTGLLSPLINITKVPSRLTPFPFGGGVVIYSYTVTNPGVVAMSNVSVVDNRCAPVTYVSGDANNNNLLDPGESWAYTCRTDVTASVMNTATAEGTANGITAVGYAFATVLVAAPGLPNTGFPPEGNVIPWMVLIVVGLFTAVFFYFTKKKHAAGH